MLNQYDREVESTPHDSRIPAFHSRNNQPSISTRLPQAIVDMPELFIHLHQVWIIFDMVRNSRFVSEFGIGSIPTSEICTLLDEFQVIDPDIRIYYIRLLQALDITYMNHMMKAKSSG